MMFFEKLFTVYLAFLFITHCTTGTPNYNSPAVPLTEANARFKQCCEETAMHINRGCLSLCNYQTTLKDAHELFKNKVCTLMDIQPMLKCANGRDKGSDNRQCCEDLGVTVKHDDTICEQFCEHDPVLHDLSKKHIKCAKQMDSILKCHHYGLKP